MNLVSIIKSDLQRYEKNVTLKNFIRFYLFTPGFKYSVNFRIQKFMLKNKLTAKLSILYKIILKRYTYKYGIQIPVETEIGEGLLIRHFGGIFIHPKTKIGSNLIISQNVTIGENKGQTPIIGDNVHICPGAKIIGNVKVGNNTIIGVNSVVIKDIPDNSVVGGVPAKILYYKK